MDLLWQQAGIVFAVAFLVTYAMVPVSKRLAHVIGAIDYPGNRHIQTEPMPRCGGIALYAGFLAACFVIFLGMRFFGWRSVELYTLEDVNYVLLFIGITAMFCVGIVDDITQLRSAAKFVAQVVAALIVVVGGGVSIETIRLFQGDYFELGWLDVPISVLYLVVFVNITNLIDGLDGLAAGIIGIAAIGLLYLTIMRGSSVLALACVAVLAVCIAFLRFNFHPASIFMGDSGSHLLGLLIGIISISGVVRTQGLTLLLVPLIIVGIPLLDTTAAGVRRRHEHKPVGLGDAKHIHHQLLNQGIGQRQSVLVLWVASAAMMACGCFIGSSFGVVRWALIAVLAVVFIVLVWKLGISGLVLQHHFDNRGKTGPRKPRESADVDSSDAHEGR